MVRHTWADHWPVLVAGAVTLATGLIVLTLAIVTAWPVPPAAARIRVVARAMGGTSDRSMTVANRTPSLLETITRFSNAAGYATRYRTLGDSAYLVETLGLEDDVRGQWLIFVNSRPVTDLAAIKLRAGDEVQLRRVPHP